MYVIETDAPCSRCGQQHKYVTTMCQMCVWQDGLTAHFVASKIEGSVVREIEALPPDIPVTIYAHKNGRPDPTIPKIASTL